MKLLSVNIGEEGTVQRKLYKEKTGIFKVPAEGAVQITKLGLPGDVIVSEKHHGGPDQAVYIYGDADYDWWRNELNRELAPGIFGENLTISGLESASFAIGDILYIGEVTLQVTAPRIPCKTFSARMEDPQLVKKFRAAERPGLYCRVLKEGKVQAGDSVHVEKYDEESVSLLDCYRDHYTPDLQTSVIQRFLDAPIAIRMREEKEKQLKKVLGNNNDRKKRDHP
ncbi:MAG: MOSC domain-containing protein [Anaerolineae bacterium]|jgi:MOSC domain-containing protein YiiM|nr:MOSC domain-containing protein [Anaerolineae bacterium]MBT7189812.1 MOSC domain-containing protein [Anaerolineae bacterium]MBT7988688.1 MOSC domain-containing protein [Anaerolineae bacterium]